MCFSVCVGVHVYVLLCVCGFAHLRFLCVYVYVCVNVRVVRCLSRLPVGVCVRVCVVVRNWVCTIV